MVKLKIETKREWLELYWALWKGGLLKDVSINDMNLSEDVFPIEFPIDFTGLVGLLNNPLAKPYKKRIDLALKENLAKVIG